jgi:methylated-DNA-[protein]-cysteine S-methyltransferase
VLFVDTLSSPIGAVAFVMDEAALRMVEFVDGKAPIETLARRQYGDVSVTTSRSTRTIREHFEAYFAGDLHAIDDIPVALDGTTFQQSVWTALRDIPAGTTTTYGALARRIGVPAAVRAVGAANGANPIPIVLPCHRVIGANGTLTGYGSGLPRKAWLLQHEGVQMPLLRVCEAS